jgi:hypothetical protein
VKEFRGYLKETGKIELGITYDSVSYPNETTRSQLRPEQPRILDNHYIAQIPLYLLLCAEGGLYDDTVFAGKKGRSAVVSQLD